MMKAMMQDDPPFDNESKDRCGEDPITGLLPKDGRDFLIKPLLARRLHTLEMWRGVQHRVAFSRGENLALFSSHSLS